MLVCSHIYSKETVIPPPSAIIPKLDFSVGAVAYLTCEDCEQHSKGHCGVLLNVEFNLGGNTLGKHGIGMKIAA
jgi:hypothetical protein